MADIFINDPSGATRATLSSEDGTTVGQLFGVIGKGELSKDGVLKANGNWILAAGVYVFVREQQKQQVEDTKQVWVEAVSQPPTTQTEYGENNLLQLATFLQQPPTTKARVSQEAFDAWKAEISETDLLDYFQPVSGGNSCRKLSYHIVALLLSPTRIMGENEDGYHGRLDECILQCRTGYRILGEYSQLDFSL